MDSRRTILIYAIGTSVLIFGAVFYLLWYGGAHPVPPDADAIARLDERIQLLSTEKPFAYNLVSLDKAADTPLPGVVWCARIDPPVAFDPTPSNQASLAEHFLIQYKFDGDWVVTKFDSRLLYEGYWTQYGCGSW